MLFELPDDETLYQALLARDERYAQRAFVGVKTTGIFCRLSCPARKPLAANCRFFATVGECMLEGFRPCKRCRPLQAGAMADPVVSPLLDALDETPQRDWRESTLHAMGYDPSTVRRAFQRHFGVTFLELARQRRLAGGFEVIANGGSVIEAQQAARFDSPAAFRSAFAKLLGCAPGTLRADALLLASWINTPLGDMIAVSSSTHLHLLEFVERKALRTEAQRLQKSANGQLGIGRHPPTDQAGYELQRYFKGESAQFATPLAPLGSDFSQGVWRELRRIPPGETMSYGDLAKAIGQPTAARAVARANGANPIALMIPCHRVIGADGSLTGYGGGLWRKQRLLEIEAGFRCRG
ncbi:trifunctional transcriptional activator/DNA repair protein Ada/methylated-DNA--[protein]-cysteine S-methyltransferase [Gammaproteobacteria bacterium]|nr:trifunctional transcriptional activator/DNA repair protein Ada/methylated-DNA--[protein]-cysteine S-methyltransferase [Gammaproteobacteria bacterium]